MSVCPHVNAVFNAAAVVRLSAAPVSIVELGPVHPNERSPQPLPAQAEPQAPFLLTFVADFGKNPFLLLRVLDDGQRAAQILRLRFRCRPAFGRKQIILVSVGRI